MLTITDYRKQYNGRTILAFQNISFAPGVHWIQGANGAGKSTLFKSIAGMIPFEGNIILDDFDIRRHPVEYRLRVSYSEAEPLYPTFVTARDLVQFIGQARRATQEQILQGVETWGLESFYTKTVETFSSGMLKKVSLACAFLGNPSVIILDEPLITLDEHSKQTLFRQLRQSAEGKTILISSHQSIAGTDIDVNTFLSITDQTILHG